MHSIRSRYTASLAKRIRLKALISGRRASLQVTATSTQQLPQALGGPSNRSSEGKDIITPINGISRIVSNGGDGGRKGSGQQKPSRFRQLLQSLAVVAFINYILREHLWDYYEWESNSALLSVCSQLPRAYHWLRHRFPSLGMRSLADTVAIVRDPKMAEQEPIFDNLTRDPAPNSRRRVVSFEHDGRKYAIRVWETGPASGPVVVVNGGTITMAAPLMRTLGKQVRVIAYEHAGMGPDAGALLSADSRQAASAPVSGRYAAIEQAAKSFQRSFENRYMVDPRLIDTDFIRKLRAVLNAFPELLQAVRQEVQGAATDSKDKVAGEEGQQNTERDAPVANTDPSPLNPVTRIIWPIVDSTFDAMIRTVFPVLDQESPLPTHDDCKEGRSRHEEMHPVGGVSKLDDRTDPSGILRRLRKSQERRLKKEHVWLYGAMDPTHGYCEPFSVEQDTLQNCLWDWNDVRSIVYATAIRRPIPSPYAPFTGVRLPFAPTPELESKELTAVLQSTVTSDDPVILVGMHMNWLSTLQFSARNAGAIAGVVLVDPLQPFSQVPLTASGVATTHGMTHITDSRPIVANQANSDICLPLNSRTAQMQDMLLQEALQGKRDAMGRKSYFATGVRDGFDFNTFPESLTDYVRQATTDIESGAQRPLYGGYHAQWLLSKVGALPRSRPYEDDCTMALPGRARPIAINANHLWMDRLVKDAAFAHNPALRQFSIDSLIGDARSGPDVYAAGKTGSRELQMAASVSRRAEYVLQQQECLRIKNYLASLYAAATEASFQEWRVAQMNTEDHAKSTPSAMRAIRDRTDALASSELHIKPAWKELKAANRMDLHGLDFDDVTNPRFPARGFLKEMRSKQSGTAAAVDRRYAVQLSMDARSIAREALVRQGCIEVDTTGTTYAKKPCPSKAMAMKTAKRNLQEIMPHEQQLAELTMFDLDAEVPWRAHNHDSVAMSGLHREMQGLLSSSRLTCPVQVLVTQPPADSLQETPAVLEAKVGSGLPRGKFLVNAGDLTRILDPQVWDTAAGPKDVGTPSGRKHQPPSNDSGVSLEELVGPSFRPVLGEAIRERVVPKLSADARQALDPILQRMEPKDWGFLGAFSEADGKMKQAPHSIYPLLQFNAAPFDPSSSAVKSMTKDTKTLVDADDLGLSISKTKLLREDAARVRVLRSLHKSQQTETSQQWEQLLRHPKKRKRQSMVPVASLTPQQKLKAGESGICPTLVGDLRVPAGAVVVPEWGYPGRGFFGTQSMQFGGHGPNLGRLVPDVGGGELEPDWGAVSEHVGRLVTDHEQAKGKQAKRMNKQRAAQMELEGQGRQ